MSNSKNSQDLLNRSDSVSSTDSDDFDFVTQLTRSLLANEDNVEDIAMDMQHLFNKENVINLLRNLLNKNMSPKTESNERNEFEINESKASLCMNESSNNSDTSFVEGLPTNLIVTSVTSEVFSNNEVRSQFENLFLEIDETCKFCHLRIFKRCTIQFSNPIAAILARIQLNNKTFCGESLKMFLSNPIKLKNSRQFLEAPKNEKSFLISPPSSPPVGWVQIVEDPPVVNLELLATLSTKLNPLEPCELIKSNNEMPGIVIHPCADSQEFFENNTNATRKFMPTRRPAYDFN